MPPVVNSRGARRVHEAPADEGRRDLDGGGRPHHEPDRRILDAGPGEGQGHGGGVGLEAHWTRNTAMDSRRMVTGLPGEA